MVTSTSAIRPRLKAASRSWGSDFLANGTRGKSQAWHGWKICDWRRLNAPDGPSKKLRVKTLAGPGSDSREAAEPCGPNFPIGNHRRLSFRVSRASGELAIKGMDAQGRLILGVAWPPNENAVKSFDVPVGIPGCLLPLHAGGSLQPEPPGDPALLPTPARRGFPAAVPS